SLIAETLPPVGQRCLENGDRERVSWLSDARALGPLVVRRRRRLSEVVRDGNVAALRVEAVSRVRLEHFPGEDGRRRGALDGRATERVEERRTRAAVARALVHDQRAHLARRRRRRIDAVAIAPAFDLSDDLPVERRDEMQVPPEDDAALSRAR